jgi:hypothetical protein
VPGAHAAMAHREQSGSSTRPGSGRVWPPGPTHEERNFFLFPKKFSNNTEVELILGKCLGSSENNERFPGGRFEYLAQLLYWAL